MSDLFFRLLKRCVKLSAQFKLELFFLQVFDLIVKFGKLAAVFLDLLVKLRYPFLDLLVH
jgi:hypothetical protein